MSVRQLVVVTFILGLLLAYRYGNIKIPDDIKLNGRMRLAFGTFKVIDDLANLGSYLGFGEAMQIGRSLTHIFQGRDYPEVGIQVLEKSLAGVPVRIYKPDGATFPSPVIIYLHGGGWFLGNLYTHHSDMMTLAKKTQRLVIFVNYKTTPEHPFPAPFNDCYSVVLHVLENSKSLDIDSQRVTLMGDSAGGNLAMAVSLKLRDSSLKHISQPKAQVLIYPAMQAYDLNTPSYQLNKDGIVIMSKAEMVSFWLYYAQGHLKNFEAVMKNDHTTAHVKKYIASSIANHKSLSPDFIHQSYIPSKLDYGNGSLWNELKDTLDNPYFAPLSAKDFKGLPQTYVLTVQYDILRDDGLWTVQKLKEAGNDITHYHEPHGFHPMMKLFYGSMIDAAFTAWDDIIQYILNKT